MKMYVIGALMLGMMSANAALAYSPEGDLMEVKGYSPEVIELANRQRSRQEWRQAPAPKHSPVEKFFHNIYYGDWTGNVDGFGERVLREH